MAKRYVITTAQSRSEVDPTALAVLENYCRIRKAKLIVLPLKYNTTDKDLFGYEDLYEDYKDAVEAAPLYDPDIEEYLLKGSIRLNDNIMVNSGVYSLPTSKDPLSGKDSQSGDLSCVYAGIQHRLKTVPTPGHKLPKILCTTPAVTRPNFSDTTSGRASQGYHTLGGVVVEVQDKKIFHLRQLTVNSKGEMYDLDRKYSDHGPAKKARVSAISYGDLHHIWADPDVLDATFFNKDSMLRVLDPEVQVVHDFIDFFSQNHHHVGDKLINYLKRHNKMDDVAEELDMAMRFIAKVSCNRRPSVIVASNHDEALDKWLNSGRGDSDPVNAALYHLLNYYRYINARMEGPEVITTTALQAYSEHFCPETLNHVTFLKRDESFQVRGVEMSFHGDEGANGARGSVKSFANIGTPVQLGHTHAPQIYRTAWQNGTSSRIKMGYNSGLGGWLQSHTAVYEDGNRSIINIIEGKWRD